MPQGRADDPLRGLQGPGHNTGHAMPPELRHAWLALPGARQELLIATRSQVTAEDDRAEILRRWQERAATGDGAAMTELGSILAASDPLIMEW